MKVSKTGGAKSADAPRKPSKSIGDGAGFADALKSTSMADEAVAVSGPSGVTSVDAILAVQQSADATDHRSRGLMVAHGTDLLDRLEQLRQSILLGHVNKDTLQDLARRLRERKAGSDDARLNDLIADIELRVEVEIAKLTR